MRIAGALLVVLVSLGTSGCWSFKKKASKPLPPLSSPSITPPKAPVDLPPEATAPIPIEPPPHPPEATVIRPDIQQPERKPPKAEAKPPARKSAPPAATPPPATAVPEATPAPVPQLGELISDERRGEMQNEIDQSLARARSTLSVAAQRALSRHQNETATRVRTFIRQAEEAKVRDISTALQLARRADLLAQDLAGALR